MRLAFAHWETAGLRDCSVLRRTAATWRCGLTRLAEDR